MSASFDLSSGTWLARSAALILALATTAVTGCSERTEARPQPALDKPPDLADNPEVAKMLEKEEMKLLKRVIEAYHQANSYQDAGRLIVRYKFNGQEVNATHAFSLAVDGPNRICLRAYNAQVVCDGRTFYAAIDTAPDEVVSLPAPEELSLPFVYQGQVLGTALNQIVGSVPLTLFLNPAPPLTLLFNAKTLELESTEKIGDDPCYRLRIERREGSTVLWIDEKSLVVRRVEYPTEGYRQLLETDAGLFPGTITDMTITAEVDGARLDPAIDDIVFRFDVPPGADLVKQFDAVRAGQQIPKFKLHALDGPPVTRDSLDGKIVVLKFWQKDDVASFYDDLRRFERVQKRYENEDSIVFLSVSDDTDDVSDDDLRAVFAKLKLSLPITRIGPNVALRSFALQNVPTTVILGKDSTLQERLEGVYPNQEASLAKKLDTLLEGGELVLEANENPPDFAFHAGLIMQVPKRGEEEPQEPAADLFKTATIAPASEPKRLSRERLWQCAELEKPGNMIAAADDSGNDRLFVIEGSSTVAEIGTNGKVIEKHQLDLPGDDSITFLRTATDGRGNRYFLASRPMAQKLYLFDANWKHLLTFPDEGNHPGIADALLADQRGNGELEILVGYLARVGVQCIDLTGQRIWTNRRGTESVFHLDVSGPDPSGRRQLLVTTGTGLLQPIDADGLERVPVGLSDAYMGLIFAADLDGNDDRELCAIAGKLLGQATSVEMAVGLSPRGNERWRYSLLKGMPHHLLFEMVAGGDLLAGDTGQWVIAGVDGSIHILDMYGNVIDRFNYGAALSGMAIAEFDGRHALVIATDDSVEAWEFGSTPHVESD